MRSFYEREFNSALQQVSFCKQRVLGGGTQGRADAWSSSRSLAGRLVVASSGARRRQAPGRRRKGSNTEAMSEVMGRAEECSLEPVSSALGGHLFTIATVRISESWDKAASEHYDKYLLCPERNKPLLSYLR